MRPGHHDFRPEHTAAEVPPSAKPTTDQGLDRVCVAVV
jgi:hypothetical protein